MKFGSIYKRDIIEAERNFGLDLVRSIAIVLVLISHLGVNEYQTGGINLGALGVELFFVLSGFLIGQILIRSFTKELSFQAVLNFWVRRWFRTIPLYYLVIVLKFLVIDHSFGSKILVYFVFLQNNFVGIDFMPVSWSLVVEEWFYLTLPLVMLVVFYKRTIAPGNLLGFIFFFITLILSARFFFVLKTDRPFAAINGNFPFRLDSMMCGVLVSALKMHFSKIYGKLSSIWFFPIMLVIYLFAIYEFGQINLQPLGVDTRLWTRTVWFLLNSICLASFLPFIEQRIRCSSQTNWLRVLVTSISVFSYCAYLIHMEVYDFLLQSNTYAFKWWVESIFAVLLTLLISGLLYGSYERPITDLREKVHPRVNR